MVKRTHEEWRALFAGQLASGLNASQFCKQQGLCPRHFSLRKKQLQWVPPLSLPVPAPAFVRVQKSVATVATATRHDIPQVLLRHGRSELELRAVSPRWLAELLVALA